MPKGFRLSAVGLLGAIALSNGCGDAPGPDEVTVRPVRVVEPQAEEEPVPLFRYNREYVFISELGDPVVIAPFSLRATDNGVNLQRNSYGWLARGPTWDRFLDETSITSRVGGVWRVVPHGDLRVIAGGAAEIESLRFTRAERRLRLDLGDPRSDWNQDGGSRYRLLDGRLSIGAETLPGSVLEVLRVERMSEDGWPPPEELDMVFVTSGDSLQLLLAESAGEIVSMLAWLRTPTGDQTWVGGEVTSLELRPYEEARRDIPIRWSFQLDDVELVGEVEASGFDALLGPERGGRRTVEVRYSVVGWVEVQDQRWPVTGMIRHTQL